MKAKSCEGVAASSYYFESIMTMNTLGYSVHLALAFSVYGETVSILIQNTIITLLIYTYDKNIGIVEKVGFLACFSGWAAFLLTDTHVPEHLWPLITSSTIFLNIFARVP